jgi:hypothetical protein
MKTTTFFFAGLFGLSCLCANAQNVQSNALATSGGLQAGTTVSGTGKNTFYGYQAGKVNTTGNGNSFVGNGTGKVNTTGYYNAFFGSDSGAGNTTGIGNTFIGNGSGTGNSTGTANAYLGSYAGTYYTTSSGNTMLGADTGGFIGANNTFVGNQAGNWAVSGDDNIYIGVVAGGEATGSRNVYIGLNAGYGLTGDDDFLLASAVNAAPLIKGDFVSGKVGIGLAGAFPTTAGGVSVSGYKLFVTGGILTEAVRVNLVSGWADYVFAKDYDLPTLAEVENHIAEKGHLINVPSAKEVEANGIDLAEMSKIQQEKIEELTLYIIAQNKTNEKQSAEIEELKAMVKTLAAKK